MDVSLPQSVPYCCKKIVIVVFHLPLLNVPLAFLMPDYSPLDQTVYKCGIFLLEIFVKQQYKSVSNISFSRQTNLH